jgi:hypothetical protein
VTVATFGVRATVTTTRFRFGLIVAACAAANVAVAQEAPPAATPPTTAPAPPAVPPAAGSQAQAPAQPRGPIDDGEFVPSQELSADEAVTFPVDI